jgi:hypothetical protein
MKNNLVVFVFLITVSSLFSQAISPDVFKISPSRFSIYNSPNSEITYCLSMLSSAYVEYKRPFFDLIVPETLPENNLIPYDELLFSSIHSLLYEYKNYDGQFNLTAYSIFALGNYNRLGRVTLEILNESILPNKNYLEMIYQWAKPYLVKAFNSLTYKEQKRLLVKLSMAERYVLNVMKEKNTAKYNRWLKANGYEYEFEDKLVGFLNRRIDKKQWKIEDCEYWINVLKTQFIPLLKDKNQLKSHYQVTDIINDEYMIACDHIAYYYILDKQYNKVFKDKFRLIQFNGPDELLAYPELDYDKIQKFNINAQGEIKMGITVN